jgi:hypothetical protein
LRSAERSRVLKVLQEAPDGLPTSEIVSLAELRGRNAADLLLSRMAADGLIERLKRGFYALPGTGAPVLEKGRQIDRQYAKPLKSEGDEHPSVDLSPCLRQPSTELNVHQSQHPPPFKGESEVSIDGSATDVRQSTGVTLDLDIPTFLKRGHPDCIFGSLEETEVVRNESCQSKKTGAEGSTKDPVMPRTVGIPFMITNRMRVSLTDLGYTSDQIAKMTPMEAHHILSGGGTAGERDQ